MITPGQLEGLNRRFFGALPEALCATLRSSGYGSVREVMQASDADLAQLKWVGPRRIGRIDAALAAIHLRRIKKANSEAASKRLCACGCGQALRVRKGRDVRFLRGHNKRKGAGDPLTAYQQKIFDVLRRAAKKDGRLPTIHAICKAAGVRYTRSIHNAIHTLQTRGYIRIGEEVRYRPIEILRDAKETGRCP